MVVNVLFIVTTSELAVLKEGSIRKSKFHCCDSSTWMSGRNLVFISSETYVTTSSLTRRCSKDRKHYHTNSVVLQILIRPKEQLTFLHPSIRLSWRFLRSLHGIISTKEFCFNFKVLFSRLSSMGLNSLVLLWKQTIKR